MRYVITTAVALSLGLLVLAACAASPTAQQSAPSAWGATLPPSLARTPAAAQAAAQATIAAGKAAMAQVQLTAAAVHMSMTQAAVTQNAMATARAQEVTATAMAAQATERAWQATATAQAQATATAMAVEAYHAEATRQAFVLSMTQQAATLEATATAQVLQAQATALAAQAERERLAVEQQRLMNQTWAVTKWALPVLFLLVIAIAILTLVRQWARMRIIRRPNGKVLVLANGSMVYDPDRNPTPILQIGPEGATLPPVSEEVQAATTARDQAVALAQATGRMPPKGGAAPHRPTPRFRILQPGERPPLALDGDTVEVLEAQWREVDE